VSRACFTYCLALVALACSPKHDKAPCTTELPDGSACGSSAPSYASDVAPILTAYCVPCHQPTGVEPNHLLDSYAHVFDERRTVLSQLYGCVMPPEGEAAPSAAQVQIVLDWLVCGAANN
jgi:hypothetical protein